MSESNSPHTDTTTNNTEASEANVDVNFRDELFKIVREFVPDLLNTFPEYKDDIDQGIYDILSEDYDTDSASALVEHCQKVYPERFFDILYQNEDIFEDQEINTEFLPGIEFKELWKKNISDTTRSVIWKYLQLIMIALSTSIKDGESFGDTAKLFEAINEDELKQKLEETFQNMQAMFDMSGSEANFSQNVEGDGGNGEGGIDVSNINLGNLPNPEEIHDHMNKMLGGKLGRLAKEIAEETAEEMDIDIENISNVNDVFKKMFRNPGKLMKMVKNIGSKLESKLSSGDINESELMKEASEMMANMKNMPGMKNMQELLGKMGLPLGKNAKMNMGAFQAHMNQNIKHSQQRERMLRKMEERKQQREGMTTAAAANASTATLSFDAEHNQQVFSKGDAPERSTRSQRPQNNNNNNKNNKGKKGKKGKGKGGKKGKGKGKNKYGK